MCIEFKRKFHSCATHMATGSNPTKRVRQCTLKLIKNFNGFKGKHYGLSVSNKYISWGYSSKGGTGYISYTVGAYRGVLLRFDWKLNKLFVNIFSISLLFIAVNLAEGTIDALAEVGLLEIKTMS